MPRTKVVDHGGRWLLRHPTKLLGKEVNFLGPWWFWVLLQAHSLLSMAEKESKANAFNLCVMRNWGQLPCFQCNVIFQFLSARSESVFFNHFNSTNQLQQLIVLLHFFFSCISCSRHCFFVVFSCFHKAMLRLQEYFKNESKIANFCLLIYKN